MQIVIDISAEDFEKVKYGRGAVSMMRKAIQRGIPLPRGMTREEFEMRTLVRESDVIDRTDGSELAKAFNYLWEKYVEQEPCEMTAEEYRQRMIQAFHNADCDELIALCVLPTEKEFEHLEWLLKTHYKKEPCDDAISRQAVKEKLREEWVKYMPMELDINLSFVLEKISEIPPVTPQPKTGHWRKVEHGLFDSVSIRWECSQCKKSDKFRSNFCFNCGARMESEVEE